MSISVKNRLGAIGSVSRAFSIAAVVSAGLVLSGCVSSSTSVGSASYAGPTVSSATARQSSARSERRTAQRELRRIKRTLRRAERALARSERRLERRRLSDAAKNKLRRDIRADKRELRNLKRDIRRAERRLARAERAEDRAERTVRTAKRRKADAERRFAEAQRAQALRERRQAEAERREQRERARAALERPDAGSRRRFGGLFSRTDPALQFVSDYSARVDNGYALAAIPVGKLNKRLYRQVVNYRTREKPGTIVVDTGARFLYLVMADGKAMRYGIGVGRAGFAWSGSAHIGWKQKWPKWTPPAEMIEREPHLEKYSAANGGMPGGLTNPLGARALYLMQGNVDTLYRLHGTPNWNSIGTAASSGCIRLINQDVIDLYNRVPNGAKVVVL